MERRGGDLAIARWLRDLTGWQRRGVAFGLGAFSVLALPPLGILPVLLVGLSGLIWLWEGSTSRRQAFEAGWWWGLGWFSLGIYWLANALLVEAATFAWLIPFATLGLGGVLAVFIGGATLLAWWPKLGSVGRLFVLAATWTLMEWCRSWVLTGFPWNPLGSVWDIALPVLQLGSLVGVFGLSLFTVLVFGLPTLLTRRAVGASLALVAVAALGGWIRLEAHPTEMVPDLRLRLIQPNLSQKNKWEPEKRAQDLKEQMELSFAPGWEKVNHILWPESAIPYFVEHDEEKRRVVAAAAPPGGFVIAGGLRARRTENTRHLWNSLLIIGESSQIVQIYDKVHLVPFGEYIPLRGILPIDTITQAGIDFQPGPGQQTLHVPGLPPFSPLICYEVVFPGSVVGRDQPRPEWLLTITNDGWFGISAGPHQHLAAARMRSIEEGLPMVRDANTGISAVFDGMGREIKRLRLGEKGVLDTDLPKSQEATVFARFGNAMALGSALLSLLIGLVVGRRSTRLPRPSGVRLGQETP